jgi:hypothetical protein
MFKGRQPIIGAPYWYNTPFDKLDFEWSREEKILIDSFCEKIQKNIDEEGGMTPLERWNALVWGKEKDRVLVTVSTLTNYAARTLDSHADAIKPIEAYKYPKLWILAHLATVARFGLDYANFHNINYGEDMWGGQSRMIDYGNPIIEPPYPRVCQYLTSIRMDCIRVISGPTGSTGEFSMNIICPSRSGRPSVPVRTCW